MTYTFSPVRFGALIESSSLSDKPGNGYFRISVKKETGAHASTPDGLISVHLHDSIQPGDVIDVGPPCGEFTIDPTKLRLLTLVTKTEFAKRLRSMDLLGATAN